MSNNSVAIGQVNAATSAIVLALSFASFVPGSIGLVLNVLIFTRPTLLRESCSHYFLWSTIFNMFVVFVVEPVRILSNSFNIDMSKYNVELCKIETFAFYSARVIPCWLITFACIDRYFHSSSNARIRQMSSVKTAKIVIGISSIVIPVLYSHILIYFQINMVPNQFGILAPSCNAQQGFYLTFLSFWHMTLYSLCPSFLMFFFGFLTLNNVRQRRQILPLAGEQQRGARRTDTQLLRMLTAQVFMVVITTLPYSINRLYTSFTANIVKSTLRIAEENLATQTVGTLTYFTNASSFYLYTLTGSIFRKELLKIVRRCCRLNQTRVQNVNSAMIQMPVLQNTRYTTTVTSNAHPRQYNVTR